MYSQMKSAFDLLVALLLFMAPAATADSSLDGNMTVTNGESTLLFGGSVPPNGFSVQPSGECAINDNGPANWLPNHQGFLFVPSIFPPVFITPPGYKPIGPVSVYCPGPPGTTTYVAARAW